MAVPRSELLTEEFKEDLRKLVQQLHAGYDTASLNNQDSLLAHKLTVADVLRARSSCLGDLPHLLPYQCIADWSANLMNRFIAELLMPFASQTTSSSPPPHPAASGIDCDEDVPDYAPSGPPCFPSGPRQTTEEGDTFQRPIKREECEMEDEDFDLKEGILLSDQEASQYTTCPKLASIHDADDRGGSSTDDSGISATSPSKHKMRITKDVPASYAYWFRGVRCPICYTGFRGQQCVVDVVKHVETYHRHKASPSVMKKLQESITPEKVIGAGMRYCGCQSCTEDNILKGYPGF